MIYWYHMICSSCDGLTSKTTKVTLFQIFRHAHVKIQVIQVIQVKMQDVEGSAELGDITRFLNIIIIMVFIILSFYNFGLTPYKQTELVDIKRLSNHFWRYQRRFWIFLLHYKISFNYFDIRFFPSEANEIFSSEPTDFFPKEGDKGSELVRWKHLYLYLL